MRKTPDPTATQANDRRPSETDPNPTQDASYWQRLYSEEQARRQHLQTVVTGLGDGLVLFDADLRFLYVNEYTLGLLERTEEEALGQAFFTLFPEAETTPFGMGLKTALREKRTVEADTYRPRSGRWWRSFIYPTEEGLTVYYRDITHLKAGEEERRYVMASAHCMLWHADVYETGNPVYLGWDIHITDEEAAQRFLPLELQPDEAYKDAKYRHRLPEDRDACDRLATTSIRAGQSYTQEFRCRCADGTLRWLREDIQVETVEPGNHWRVVAVCVDITDHKRLQQQFLQAQKMEGIGRLAGGIAHDFNNLLSVILGYAEMVEMELPEDSDLLPNVHNIQSAAGRAAKLTSQLLAFARKQVSAAKVLNPNDLIRDMGQILKPLIREDIELITLLKEEVGNIKADPAQLEQVLVNLVVNARDAMPEGGKILIQTENVLLSDRALQEPVAFRPGEYVLLAISDTGMGMTEEVKGRLFEPFFTTKEVGKGTGLGLATAYGIVKQSDGYIFVYSEEGIGTTVKVYLPRVDAAARAWKKEVKANSALQGEETILVVEDERLVRDLTVTTLLRNGYKVLQAENGQEALQIAREYLGEIHLVVTDAIMPVLGGKDLADRLGEVRPQTQVMYVSGYTEEVTSIRGILPEGTAFLQKPFTAQALLTRAREVLNRGGK